MDEIAISKFKASCLAILKRVKQTGKPVLVTKRGEPVARVLPPEPLRGPKKSAFGCLSGTAEELVDIVEPLPAEDWEALR